MIISGLFSEKSQWSPTLFYAVWWLCVVCRQVGCRLHLPLSGTADSFPGELPHSPTTVAAGNTQGKGEYNVQNKALVGDNRAKGALIFIFVLQSKPLDATTHC